MFVKVYGLHATGGRGVAVLRLLYAPAPLNSPQEPVWLEMLTKTEIVPMVYELHR